MLEGSEAVGIVTKFSCVIPHFLPFHPIPPHCTPPPKAHKKWLLGLLTRCCPHFSIEHHRTLAVGPISPHFPDLGLFFGGITGSFPAAGN